MRWPESRDRPDASKTSNPAIAAPLATVRPSDERSVGEDPARPGRRPRSDRLRTAVYARHPPRFRWTDRPAAGGDPGGRSRRPGLRSPGHHLASADHQHPLPNRGSQGDRQGEREGSRQGARDSRRVSLRPRRSGFHGAGKGGPQPGGWWSGRSARNAGLGIFTEKFLTSFVTYVLGDDLFVHLSRLDDSFPTDSDDTIPEPWPNREVMPFKVLVSDGDRPDRGPGGGGGVAGSALPRKGSSQGGPRGGRYCDARSSSRARRRRPRRRHRRSVGISRRRRFEPWPTSRSCAARARSAKPPTKSAAGASSPASLPRPSGPPVKFETPRRRLSSGEGRSTEAIGDLRLVRCPVLPERIQMRAQALILAILGLVPGLARLG